MKCFISYAQAIKSKSTGKIKLLLAHVTLYIKRRPWLKRVALALLMACSLLKRWIIMASHLFSPIDTELTTLTPRARRIYANLKAAREHHKKEEL
ncbi:MAG: hypothetical protein P4L65_07980 [Legionella sp.]|nr:hypothetical protein [Legionella sp.]